MAKINVPDVGKYGILTDVPPSELPLEAWTFLQNVKMVNNYAERSLGDTAITGAPLFPPRNIFPSPNTQEQFWVYAGLTNVASVIPGVSSEHTDITRIAGPYNGSVSIPWTGTWLGQVLYLTNGADVPQVWQPITAGTPLRDLDNWPALTTARVMRSYKDFVLALNVTKDNAQFPAMVKWSHPAEAGFVPASWDEANPIYLAGEKNLSETAGIVVDCLGLGDANIVYKSDAVIVQQFVQSNDIFTWRTISTGVGLMAQQCVAEFRPRMHIFLTREGDLVVNDGINIESVLDKRNFRYLESHLNNDTKEYSFIVVDSKRKEVWVCFPEVGQTICTAALVWNWKDNTFAQKQLTPTYDIKRGLYDENIVPLTWIDFAAETWDTIAYTWQALALRLRVYQQQLLTAAYTVPGITLQNTGYLTNTAEYTSIWERKGITAYGVDYRNGVLRDPNTVKLLTEVWPSIDADAGTIVLVYTGYHDQIEDDVIWDAPVPFVVGQDRMVPVLTTGRHLAVKFTYTGTAAVRFRSYAMEVSPVGRTW